MQHVLVSSKLSRIWIAFFNTAFIWDGLDHVPQPSTFHSLRSSFSGDRVQRKGKSCTMIREVSNDEMIQSYHSGFLRAGSDLISKSLWRFQLPGSATQYISTTLPAEAARIHFIGRSWIFIGFVLRENLRVYVVDKIARRRKGSPA